MKIQKETRKWTREKKENLVKVEFQMITIEKRKNRVRNEHKEMQNQQYKAYNIRNRKKLYPTLKKNG